MLSFECSGPAEGLARMCRFRRCAGGSGRVAGANLATGRTVDRASTPMPITGRPGTRLGPEVRDAGDEGNRHGVPEHPRLRPRACRASAPWRRRWRRPKRSRSAPGGSGGRNRGACREIRPPWTRWSSSATPRSLVLEELDPWDRRPGKVCPVFAAPPGATATTVHGWPVRSRNMSFSGASMPRSS